MAETENGSNVKKFKSKEKERGTEGLREDPTLLKLFIYLIRFLQLVILLSRLILKVSFVLFVWRD